MASTLTAQVSLNMVSNVPEDRSVNVMHFITSGPDATVTNAIAQTGAIQTFYRGISAHLSTLVSLTGHSIKWYDALAPSSPNGPLFTTGFTLLGLGTGNPLPTEVALCSSFSGDVVPGGGENVRTNRGRIYIGPLASSALGANGRPVPALVTSLSNGALALAVNPTGDLMKMVVFSRKLQAAIPIRRGFVDDEFDTQRRRGRVRLSRTAWALAA